MSEKRERIAQEIVPVIEKMSPIEQEKLLSYAKGLVDQKEFQEAQKEKEAS